MKKLIIWREDISKIFKISFILFFLSIPSSKLYASERWVIDKNLSTIEFELPVLLANNVQGKFNNIEGYVELDVDKKINNKAIFSVQVDDLI